MTKKAISTMNPANINLYRITHIDNIPHILTWGITHRQSAHADPHYRHIGDTSMVRARAAKKVPVTNGGGRAITHITLGDFTPFYFGVRMPMLYVIQQGGNFVPAAVPPEDIVYVVCALARIGELENLYYFTDGHATDMLTTFYDKEKIDELPQIIDWRAVKAAYWGSEENLDIKRKKQAEFLVQGDIPAGCIIGYGCYNNRARNRLIGMGVGPEMIKVIRKAYF